MCSYCSHQFTQWIKLMRNGKLAIGDVAKAKVNSRLESIEKHRMISNAGDWIQISNWGLLPAVIVQEHNWPNFACLDLQGQICGAAAAKTWEARLMDLAQYNVVTSIHQEKPYRDIGSKTCNWEQNHVLSLWIPTNLWHQEEAIKSSKKVFTSMKKITSCRSPVPCQIEKRIHVNLLSTSSGSNLQAHNLPPRM